MSNAISTLTERAMVMNLSIGIWQGYRLDRAASAKVTSENGAHADAARVNKHLVPKEALAPVASASGALRAHFYEHTLPWRDNGDRLMTRKLFLDFVPQHEQLVGEFDASVDKFLDNYPSMVEQAGFRMGELFNRDDYPSVRELRHKFYAELDIAPIATADDFRVDLDAEHVEKVRASIEAAAEKRVQTAMADVWKRIAETVGYMQERLAKPDAVFRDSLFGNVAELVELIPGLNMLDDPAIEALRQQIKDRLTGHNLKDVRKDPAFRAEIADDAKQIMDQMAGFMKAFGGGSE